ncbi:hypothetical protein CLOM_g17328 [Closterium sp. NIES-68]|nr:hypothetical protein CLOM_g17328 [Closterium sp. NIES-68]GJP73149.1 hypothetical protein CLOP_g3888 [Closterium sp. NIES-67]
MALVPFNDRSNTSPPESSSITDSRNNGLVVWEGTIDDTDDLAFVEALELAEASAKRRRTGESAGDRQRPGRQAAVAGAGNSVNDGDGLRRSAGGGGGNGGGWSGGGGNGMRSNGVNGVSRSSVVITEVTPNASAGVPQCQQGQQPSQQGRQQQQQQQHHHQQQQQQRWQRQQAESRQGGATLRRCEGVQSGAGATGVASASGAVVASSFSTQPATPNRSGNRPSWNNQQQQQQLHQEQQQRQQQQLGIVPSSGYGAPVPAAASPSPNLLPAQPLSPAQPAQPVVMRPADFRNMQSAALDVLEPGDYMVLQGKPYIKKSGWRKIAFFFNVSFEIRDKTIERDERGNVTRSEFLVRASMSSGRFSDAWGSCDRGEKRFSKPNHDIPGTAETRAKSRACQDLLGIGEYKQYRT